MKSFAPSFNLSVLNLGLKSGIWAGVTAISFASGAVTIVNNWTFLRSQAEEFYEVTIKTYILNPLFQGSEFMKKHLVAGHSIMYRRISSWYEWVSSSSAPAWIRKHFTVEKFLEAYSLLFGKSWQYVSSSFLYIKYFFESDFAKWENFRLLISAMVNAINFAFQVIHDLLGGNNEEVKQLIRTLKELFGDENFRSILYELISVLFKYPEIIRHLSMEDIQNALFYSMGNYYADFKQKADHLRQNPIDSSVRGQALKEEVMKRLFPELVCNIRNGLLMGLGCAIKKGIQDILTAAAFCEEGKSCDNKNILEETTMTFLGGGLNTVGGYYAENHEQIRGGVKNFLSGFLSSFGITSGEGSSAAGPGAGGNGGAGGEGIPGGAGAIPGGTG